ncbi:hypothetical protein M404DRAFT_295583 [Pisolithus tinctorius Marx 270]|uniref:Uncharacterized protein n=1 Tax=Pisolithus tinctorius Marx 270 TaxID=870435 RepID=A0A0C3NKB7_PISTI|nr:hypothetical protein M404DRAFT_295583 [Pisolithus tinctorius Marx 270]
MYSTIMCQSLYSQLTSNNVHGAIHDVRILCAAPCKKKNHRKILEENECGRIQELRVLSRGEYTFRFLSLDV